jgi:hypothetical protein
LCDRSIDGADDEILLHPPADLFELEKMWHKRGKKKKKGTWLEAGMAHLLLFFSIQIERERKTETSFLTTSIFLP